MAAGILPAVEGGILPPGRTVELEKIFASPNGFGCRAVFPPGRMVLAHGHQAGKMPATTLERAGTLRAGHFASGLSLGEVTGTVSVVFMLYHW